MAHADAHRLSVRLEVVGIEWGAIVGISGGIGGRLRVGGSIGRRSRRKLIKNGRGVRENGWNDRQIRRGGNGSGGRGGGKAAAKELGGVMSLVKKELAQSLLHCILGSMLMQQRLDNCWRRDTSLKEGVGIGCVGIAEDAPTLWILGNGDEDCPGCLGSLQSRQRLEALVVRRRRRKRRLVCMQIQSSIYLSLLC